MPWCGSWPSRASPSASVAVILGVHLHDAGLVATAVVVLAVKGVVIPVLLGAGRRAVRSTGSHGRWSTSPPRWSPPPP